MSDFEDKFLKPESNAVAMTTEVEPRSNESNGFLRTLAKEAIILGIALPVSLVGRLLGAEPGAGYLAVRSMFDDAPEQQRRPSAPSQGPKQ